jgi:hypothetical protein
LAHSRGFTESLSDEAVRGFLKHFAPNEFVPDEISVLEDALEDAWRRVEQSETPWTASRSPPLAIARMLRPHDTHRVQSLARATDDPVLKEPYEDLAVDFAQNAQRQRDLDSDKPFRLGERQE